MRLSISHKLTALVIIIVGFVIMFTWTLNLAFSERFYIMHEKQTLLQTFERSKKILGRLELYGDTYITKLDELSYGNNIRCLILQQDELGLTQDLVYSNLNEGSLSFTEILNYLNQVRLQIKMSQEEEGTNPFFPSIAPNVDDELQTLVDKGYLLVTMDGKQSNEQGLYLFGYTDDGYLIGMYSPIANIHASAQISSRFLAYMSFVGILFGSFIIAVFSMKFIQPIQEMSQVANRMSKLDFDAKVDVHTGDELEELGRAMNEMSEKLESTIADLKEANLELTRDIQQKEEVDEMRKEFLSHVSHELKTPIAIIQGYAEGLRENVIEDEESKMFYCEVIEDEAQKMNKMVKNLLALNQLEFGQTQLAMERFDIIQLIYNKVNASQILFSKKDIQVEFLPTESVYVWADEFMIEEVFSNYLSNAINHVFEHGTIRIWTEPKDGEVRVHVYNDGNQIPEEELNKLWIKFYKVDKARTREYGGNGIGLSIVAASMKAHGKAFGVSNCENGVDFYFDLDTTA